MTKTIIKVDNLNKRINISILIRNLPEEALLSPLHVALLPLMRQAVSVHSIAPRVVQVMPLNIPQHGNI